MTNETQQFKSGEKGFSFFLLAFGLFFTWQSLLLYQESPELSSYGSVPLFCSLAISILSLLVIITDWNKESVNSGKAILQQVKNALSHLFTKDVIVMVAFVVAYCSALCVGVNFMISTPVFLWVSMTFLSRGNYVKNLLWSALCMGFIYVVFQILFSVVLP